MLSCVDGSVYARFFSTDVDRYEERSCVRPVGAVYITAGLDEVRTLVAIQASELVSPDNTLGCPNFSSFKWGMVQCCKIECIPLIQAVTDLK